MIFHDKEFIVADSNAASPKKNNVYATWTRFTAVSNSPINFSQSTDGGATWSPGVEISGTNAAICTIGGVASPDACDQDQGSHPIVGKDGTIYVVFGNANTPAFGVNQVLFVKCPAGERLLGRRQLERAGEDQRPRRHCTRSTSEARSTGCPPGRQCLPPNGYRVPEFTSMSLSIDMSDNLYAVWSDFRNGGPPCDTLDTATAAPPCDNDVFYAYSTDGGSSWSDAREGKRRRASAQWQPWSDVRSDGKSLFIAYYDRSYGNCETRQGATTSRLRRSSGQQRPIRASITIA